MATAIESGIGTLNYGRQSAKGTAATAATLTVGYNRPKWEGGTLGPAKKLGQSSYIDGQRFASPSMFTDSINGEVGQVTVQLQPENAGLFSAAVLGVDTVTGSADPYTHTITSAGTSGQWGTWWVKVGSAVGPERTVFVDSKIAKLQMVSTFQDKVLRGVMDIQALTSQTFTTDAAKTEDTSDPYYHTEATGSFTVDSLAITEVFESTLDIDTQMAPFYGDNIAPVQLIEKKGLITRSMKAIVTDGTIAKYRLAVYNSATPTTGTAPQKDVFYASMTQTFTRSATRTLAITTSRVAIDPADMVVSAQADGGEMELSLGGTCLKNGATPAVSIVALAGDATTYA